MKTNSISLNMYLLAVSNLLFVGSYAFLAIHALFLYDPLIVNEIKTYIVLGMSVFGATQVGGVWLLSLINDSLSKSIKFISILRITGILLLLVPTGISIVVSLLCFGLSHAAYYKTSRLLFSEYLKKHNSSSSKSYLIFSLTTNVSFLLFPYLGSIFLLVPNGLYLGVFVSFLLAAIGILVLTVFKRSVLDIQEDKESKVVEQKISQKEFVADILRFAAFVLPYTIMMALIPIKTQSLGLPAVYNSIFLGFNSLIIILFQLVATKTKIAEYSLLRYDVMSIAAVILTVLALIVDIWLVVPLFIVWSICESYQMPNLEFHLFSKRSYSSKKINNILALDAIFCFLGPIVAGLQLFQVELKKISSSSEMILRSIVNFFI